MDDATLKEKLAQYKFYHILKLKEGLETPGQPAFVPLQQKIRQALHALDLKGKRVLDIGCRDGMFCFEAERKGAREVIGIDNDLSRAATEFLIPYFDSHVKMFELNVYDLLPESFGKFDVIIFAGVLYHLRYPFWGLKRVRDVLADDGQLILETAVVEAWHHQPILYCPVGSDSPYEPTSVTFYNLKGLTDTLRTMGVSVQRVDYLIAGHNLKWRLRRWLTYFGIRKFINRATLTCKLTPETAQEYDTRYWDGTHNYHTTANYAR
jgi:SAM-dependent methyltransferase